MPPRRAVARNAATPARSTRGSSAVPLDSSVSRRVTRGSSQQPGVNDDVVNNPQLPELQTQQSYAYGSTKTPLLPEQLVARERMTLREMAETIDAGVRQADRHFEEHVAEAQGNLEPAVGGGEGLRSRRKTSKEASTEPALNDNKLERQKKDRVAAWADSLDSSGLDDIAEEEGLSEPETPDDATRKDTDPSSFPSGIFDHSYNYERGLRKPQPPRRQGGRVRTTTRSYWHATKRSLTSAWSKLEEFTVAVWRWIQRIMAAISQAVVDLPDSPIFTGLTKATLGLLVASAAGMLFCFLFTNFACDSTSTSIVSLSLQKLCGSCAVSTTSYNLTGSDMNDMGKLSAAVNNINKQIRVMEGRLGDKFDSRFATLQAEVDALKRRQTELASHLANKNSDQGSLSSESITSPLLPQINFFAPYNGAVVDPHRTSPTREKQVSLVKRVALSAFGFRIYSARPPRTALEAWHDVGDCWCSANAAPGQDFARLGVSVKEFIYPTEIVVEHFPAAGSLNPDIAPKDIELWADLSHLGEKEWQQRGSQAGQENNILGPQFALVGKMVYDASARAPHVQAFRLSVNQAGHVNSAQRFVVRVLSTYGSGHTCLYRVRLHGVPVAAHPEAEGTAEWYKKHGYSPENRS